MSHRTKPAHAGLGVGFPRLIKNCYLFLFFK